MQLLKREIVIGSVWVAWLFGVVTGALAQEGPQASRNEPVTKQLVDLAARLYELNEKAAFLYARAFKTGEAGEGIPSQLFNDPIRILLLALDQDQANVRARLYLGKSYAAKAYQGEGNWSKDLLLKAEEQFEFILNEGKRRRVSPQILETCRRELRSVKAALANL